MTTLTEMNPTGIHVETILVENDELPLLVTFEAWKEPRLGWGILDVTDKDANPIFPNGDQDRTIDKAVRAHLEELKRRQADG